MTLSQWPKFEVHQRIRSTSEEDEQAAGPSHVAESVEPHERTTFPPEASARRSEEEKRRQRENVERLLRSLHVDRVNRTRSRVIPALDLRGPSFDTYMDRYPEYRQKPGGMRRSGTY